MIGAAGSRGGFLGVDLRHGLGADLRRALREACVRSAFCGGTGASGFGQGRMDSRLRGNDGQERQPHRCRWHHSRLRDWIPLAARRSNVINPPPRISINRRRSRRSPVGSSLADVFGAMAMPP